MSTSNTNPALVFSGILEQLGALSLLMGLYRFAFPSKKNKNDKNAPQPRSATSCFLNCFSLFAAAQAIKAKNPVSPANFAASNPGSPANAAPSNSSGRSPSNTI